MWISIRRQECNVLGLWFYVFMYMDTYTPWVPRFFFFFSKVEMITWNLNLVDGSRSCSNFDWNWWASWGSYRSFLPPLSGNRVGFKWPQDRSNRLQKYERVWGSGSWPVVKFWFRNSFSLDYPIHMYVRTYTLGVGVEGLLLSIDSGLGIHPELILLLERMKSWKSKYLGCQGSGRTSGRE